MARSPETLHAAAVELVNRGNLGSARRMLDTAAQQATDPDLRARIAGTLALIYARSGALENAERTCEEALRTPGIARATYGILAGQMGSVAEQAGRLDDADRWLGRALAMVEDPIPLANLLINRSIVNMQRGRLDDAATYASEAANAYAAQEKSVEEAEARHALGYIDLLRGDLVGALQEMQSARPTLSGVSEVYAAIGDADRAEVLRDAGLTTEAEQILARAAPVFGRRRMPRYRAEVELNLARSFLTHDPSRARSIARAAGARFRALGNETWAARCEAVQMRAELSGGAYTRSGDRFAEPPRIPAAEEVASVAADLDRNGFRSEAAALRMSRELWRSRHGAIEGGASRVIRPPATASMEVRLLAHAVRAERAAAGGRQGEARRHAARGLDTLSTWQQEFGSLDLQTSIVMHGDALVGVGLRSAVSSRRADVIFEWSERARHIMLQVVPLRPPPDPVFAAELAELRMLRAEGDADGLTNSRAAELQQRAREHQWSGTRSAAVEKRATLVELAGALEAETALICYVYSGKELIALVATPDRATVLPIDRWPDLRRAMPGLRADLDMAASVRAGPMAAVVRRSLDDRLAALSAALLDEPADAAGARRLVITTPGVLNGIPWAMLPGMRGRAFTLAASASRWVRQRAEDTGRTPTSPAGGRVGFAVGPRVARGEEEVDSAASAWQGSSVLRHATVDDVAELATDVDVLHIAAHGRHAVDNPMFSGLELADGTLFGYDIDRIPRVPETVVLSACEAGRSSVRWGEEAVGMTRIWLHAGTRSVIAAPVVVADDDACELLGAMHEGLAAGHPPAEALAEATRKTGIVAPFQTHGAGF